MAGSTIDHLVSVTIFLAAIMLFISFFNQTLQTAILYQRHRNLSTKCGDLLDGMMLNPGIPYDWGISNCTPTGFGLQDPEFTSYKLSPFTLMRLQSLVGTPFNYPKTGKTYSNVTMGFGNFMFVPYTEAINYSLSTRLLGIRDDYGFQLTIMPTITVSITQTLPGYPDPLRLTVNVNGIGFPLSNAALSYCFLKVVEQGGQPSYTSSFGTSQTNDYGIAVLDFQEVTEEDSYALIVYARLSGLIGVGCHERVFEDKQYILPLIDSFSDRTVALAHSYDVNDFGPPRSEIKYNATFVLLTEDFTLREISLGNSTGHVNHGEGCPYGIVTIPTYNPGILVITYKSNNDFGVVLMPWGISSLAFPVTFGDNPFGKEWVATDIRQVTVNGIAYQTKLALWSLEGYQVMR